MTKWARSGVLDDGLNDIRNNATRMLLVSAYSAGDSYATVLANRLAEAAMTSADFTLGTSGSNRTLTTASGKTAVATAAATGTPDLHLVFCTASAVVWATDETTNVAVAISDTINFPSVVYTAQQPT